MPELRRDPTTGNWVIIASERAKRPGGVGRGAKFTGGREHDPSCPFCAGNEAMTPPEIARRPEAGEWVARVVPNKYPALVPDPPASARASDDLRVSQRATGRYEVIVEGQKHQPVASDPATLLEVFLAAQERCREFATDGRLASIALFRNHGVNAGASLIHPHWQLAAMPLVPRPLGGMLEVAHAYRRSRGASLYRDLVRDEVENGSRVVAMNASFVAMTPYAPQWSGEVWVLPRDGEAHFVEVEVDRLREFADLFAETVDRVARAFERPDYNALVFSAPLRASADDSFSWHARLQPRLTVQGGFELFSAIAITVLAPEQTARLLRGAE